MLARGTSKSQRSGFRSDIEGLRAIAILAVVLYHARVSALGGGYVGVDVFFVISGFLITRILDREIRQRRKIGFGSFYARRARRLLPSAVLVIAATVAVSVLVLSPLRAEAVAKDGLAAALYGANYRFAVLSTSYLSASGPPSPFLHYWSLGVEEQFYLIWPGLLVVSSLVWWHHRRPSQRSTGAVLAIMACASFVLSLWLTRLDPPWAFFSLPTRAWELAAGGLLALVAPRLSATPRWLADGAGWAGIGLIVWSAVSFGSTTPFPGTAALAPVLGAAAVIAAGCTRSPTGPVALLEQRPFQWLGLVSYTWYLWHWPALVLAPDIVGNSIGVAGNLVVCAVSLMLAIMTTLFVERPLRRAPWLALRPRRGLFLAAGTSGVAVLAVATSITLLPMVKGSGLIPHTRLAAPRGDLVGSTFHRSASPGPAPSQTTVDQAIAQQLTAQVQNAVARSVGVQQVPANLQPPLASASSDEAPPFYDGCFDGFTDTVVHPCNYGDVNSSHTVVLFGDSHALMWFPAIDNIANQQGWHLVAAAKATCPPIDIPIFSPDLDEWYSQCNTWRAAELQRIAQLHPAVVILGFSREYGISNDHVVVDGPAWIDGLDRMIMSLRAVGSQVVVLGDVPYPSGLVPDCLAAHLTDAAACLIPKGPPAINKAGITQEQAVVTAAGGSYIDTEPWFCARSACAVMVENMVVYRDDNHITATYANWLIPVIQADLAVATHGVL